MSDRSDLVDHEYAAFVRPLGNLVIAYAQAEAALLKLAELIQCKGENAAYELLKGTKVEILPEMLCRHRCFLAEEAEDLERKLILLKTMKEDRNRLIHDDWFVGIYEDITSFVGTRGVLPKKPYSKVYQHPYPDEIWSLAKRFCDLVKQIEHLCFAAVSRETDFGKKPFGPWYGPLRIL